MMIGRMVCLALVGSSFLTLSARTVSASMDSDDDEDLADAIAADREDGVTTANSGPGGQTLQNAMNPTISFIADMAAAWMTEEHAFTQGGHAVDDSGFSLQGLELAASASVDPYFRFDLYMQLVGMEIEEAAISTLSLPFNLQVRAGYLMVPFGRENNRHLHQWRFTGPSLAHSRFLSPEHFSGLGTELSVLLPLPWYSMVYLNVVDPVTRKGLPMKSATFGHVVVEQDHDNGELVLADDHDLDDPRDMVYSARLESSVDLSDDWTLVLGASAAFGESRFVPANRAALYGMDFYLKWRPISKGEDSMALSLTAEYFVRDTQVPLDSVRDHGGYLQMDFQLDRRWIFSVRADNTSTLDGRYPDTEAAPQWHWRAGLAAAFMPTHFSRVKLEYDAGRVHGLDETAHMVVLQIEVSAGSHGAHAF